jgi:hypothetical protein
MLYIQKSVSENAGIAVIGVEKYKHFTKIQQPSIISPHLV